MIGAATVTDHDMMLCHDEVDVDIVGKLLATAKLSPGDNNANRASSASRLRKMFHQITSTTITTVINERHNNNNKQ